MKNNKSLKIKILLIGILLIIVSVATYISLPNISNAIESKLSNITTMLGAISSSIKTEILTEKIREHRGYWNYGVSYSEAEEPYGITNIDTYISTYLEDAYNKNYGWYFSLAYNTSIFCREKGGALPGIRRKNLQTFHVGEKDTHHGGSINGNEGIADEKGDTYIDYIEHLKKDAWYKCTGENTLTLLPANWVLTDETPETKSVEEWQFDWRNGNSTIASDENASNVARAKEFIQHTLVSLDYEAGESYFDPMQSYYFSYSTREFYKKDPSQIALWIDKNGKDYTGTGRTLYNAAAAVTHTLYGKITAPFGSVSIVKPTMSATDESGNELATGTIIDGTNYKIGPIYMSDYTYAWSSNVKGFSGTSSLSATNTQAIVNRMSDTEKEFYKGLICGIIEMKIELDNDTIVYVDGESTVIDCPNPSDRATFSNTYYESPSKHDEYYFPAPKSEFYIKIPIASCKGATKIEKITVTYKWTEVDGRVGDIKGTFHDLEWTGSKELGGCASSEYDCTNIIDEYECTTNAKTACYHTLNYYKHNFNCGTTGYCNYCSENAGKPTTCDGGKWEDAKDGTRGNGKHESSSTTCGYSEHTHGSNCGNWQCGYSSGDYTCGHTPHTHTDSCKHKCTINCNTSPCEKEGTYECGEIDCAKNGCPTHTHINKYYTDGGCCGKKAHTHTEWDNADSPGCYATNTYSNCCPHGFDGSEHKCGKTEEHEGDADGCSAHNWGDTHIGDCYGCGDEGKGKQDEYTEGVDDPSRCPHGHAFCAKCIWECTDDTEKNAQELTYVVWTEVTESVTECYIENIPLIAKVEIFKYIYDVEHNEDVVPSGASDNTYVASDDRRKLDEDAKKANPVYVESDDFITYKIIMKNSSAFGVKIRFDDVLPVASAYEFIEAKVGTETFDNIAALREKVVVISANSEASATVKIQVKALEGKYENKARIITRNGTPKNEDDDIDYIRTEDDNGPIVNHIEVESQGTTDTPAWESSDWFILNNYNTYIDKYLYKYDELVQKENNTNKFTEEASVVDASQKLNPSRANTNLASATKPVEYDTAINDTYHTLGSNETNKANHPVNVEQRETVTYAIRIVNDATTVEKKVEVGEDAEKKVIYASKTATQLKPTKITDKLHSGLKYTGKGSVTATIFYKNGSVKKNILEGIECKEIKTEGDYVVYELITDGTVFLEPGEYIEYYLEAKVVQSNMYLYSMDNTAEITTLSNINDVVIYDKPEEGEDEGINRLVSEPTPSIEYVRQKDLVISGSVWVDMNKDGLISGDTPTSFEKSNYNINDKGMKSNVLVRLYRVSGETATVVRTTRTNSDGLYTFGKTETSWRDTFNHLTTTYNTAEGAYQRVDKASGKDSYGNYTANSEYYSYYVEFEYDGVIYKSTLYSGMSNLTKNDGRYNTKYPIDSNATELEKDRENFNKRYEYISYNIAYGYNNNTYDLNDSSELKFEKLAHESYLIEDPSRNMTSKSFVVKYDTETVLNACKLAKDSCGAGNWKQCDNHWDDWQVVIAMGLIDESQYPNTADGRLAAQAYLQSVYNTLNNNASTSGNTQMIKYLWLYSFNESTDSTKPETDYLKYINLGLELREDVDLALTKDVYNLKTTIGGEEMEYDFNIGDTGEYLNDYVVKKPYGFEIYESDYKYRVEQYISEAVEAYKGANGEDELNIEITYRINLQNLTTRDDEERASQVNDKNELVYGGNDRINNNTPLNVKVHEVLDLYDENFIKDVNEVITTKVRNAEGLLDVKQIKAGEAWMFMLAADAGDRELLEGGQRYTPRASNGGSKPIYVPDASGDYVKVKLDVSSKSIFSSKDNSFEEDGYSTAYISGMEDQVIPEGGEGLDIYVKYVVDKADLQIEVAETYNETKTSTLKMYTEETQTIEIKTIENGNISGVIKQVEEKQRINSEGGTETYIEATLSRAIKLAEKTNTTYKNPLNGGRGTENIAQINAYSVWYEDGKPASLVDKDSNAGNIGITPDGTTSADNIEYYEDMTYKTGIELVAERTENDTDKVIDEYNSAEFVNKYGTITLFGAQDPIRKINGTIWDDSRTETLGSGYEIQYIADGKYDTSKSKLAAAKSNENVRLNYKDESVTEDIDIAVRSAKAEFIEVIKVDDTHYYEEVLTHVTWPQKQNDRTDTNGAYSLEGFKPGRYIVRFTYGDTAENTVEDPNIKNDMLIFNGQDYKSTQYTGVSDKLDTINDADKIIQEFEKAGSSDARDDEVRRLEVNAYSEIMTNELAEILKGLANNSRELTPNSVANEPEELQALTDNTYMTADTREFLVKAEKLTQSQTTSYIGEVTDEIYYMALEALKNEHIEQRDFTINNVDLGIEYRPESEISLMKEIREIKLTTEDGDMLVDLHFKTTDDGDKRKHEIIKDESTGHELVQFITNNYSTKALVNNLISEEYLQGLVYIQVDEELLQGCTIEITYGFEAQNSSEIDRISKKLDYIRYRNNQATEDLIQHYKTDAKYQTANKLPTLFDFDHILNTKYTASALSKAAVFADTYAVDDQGLVYREIPKATTEDGEDGYFGRFVGHSYYSGTLTKKEDGSTVDIGLDTIASLKFDKILDYIDTNLEYEQKTNAEDVTNKFWSKITCRELVSLVSHYKGYRYLLNTEGATEEDFPLVTNIDGVEYKSMVVSIDDRLRDDKYTRKEDEFKNIDNSDVRNNTLAKFLLPKVSIVGPKAEGDTGLVGTDELGKQLDKEGKNGYDDYTGSILLNTSKVLAAGSEDDDKTYENMAEIVQFTTQTGRRTNFATTIGNADIHAIEEKLENKEPPFDDTIGNNSGSIEFITASVEPDTSATETITLIPPTGLMKNRRAIVSIMETAKTGVEVMSMTGLVVAIIAVAVIIVLFVIRKYQKRRIK